MATRIRSFSKVNLGLRIGAVREDGFHGLKTVYQTLALHDVVTVSARRLGLDRANRIRLTTDHPRVPVDGRNTAWQMVERALGAMEIRAEVEIHIEKRLPVQGGMGAGSANAAATLIALEKELLDWATPGPVLTGGERMRVAAEVGSDVPLFLVGGAVLGEGRGERVTAMADLTLENGRGVPCVVALPDVSVSTPFAFREWDARHADGGPVGGGSLGAALLTSSTAPCSLGTLSFARPYSAERVLGDGSELGTSGIAGDLNPDGASEVEQRGARGDLAENTLLALVRTGIENDFEEVVFPYHPSLRETKRLLMGEDSGMSAIYAALSGSGSALFGLYRSEDEARAAQQRVRSSGTEAILTETLTRNDYWARMFADVG